jgi:hypothetical protein
MDAFTDPTWRVATNGIRPGCYGVARFAGGEWLETANGNVRWFRSAHAARRVADDMNAPA